MPNADSRIAVVIATRNRAALLGGTLARLTALPERPRVIVVDNGSTDGTAAIARAAGPQVKLISLPHNRGAAARNLGVAAAGGTYVAFADDDSWYEPGSLAHAADLLDAHPRLGLIAARVLVGPERELDPTCRAMARSPLPRPPGDPGPAVLGFLACGAAVRRTAFTAVGGFSERIGIGGEEHLLAVDLAAAGWHLAYAESVVAHHHPPPRLDPHSRRRAVVCSDLWTAWLRRRPCGAFRRTARLVRGSLFDAAGRAGLADAVRGIHGVLHERRPVPPALERQLRLID
jgi:GT2 family glycosyltransferase